MAPHYEHDEEELDLNQEVAESQGIPLDDVRRLQDRIQKANKYSLEETATRNILIVGRTRTGKSTAVGVMKNPTYEPKKMSLFSDSVDAKFQSFSLDARGSEGSCKYTVNVIDTPGLKEVKAKNEVARSDEVIMDTINLCLKNEITKINVLLIFISFEIGVTEDDVDAFKQYLAAFLHDEITICMCITRAEEKTKAWRESIIEQLQNHSYFSEVLARKNVFVTFIGCVETTRFQTLSSTSDLQKLYINVYQMRESLLKVIFDATKQVKLSNLPIAAKFQEKLGAVFESQYEILKSLSDLSKLDEENIKGLVTHFAANTNLMLSYEGLLENEYFGEYQKFQEKLMAIVPTLSEENQKIFLGRLNLA